MEGTRNYKGINRIFKDSVYENLPDVLKAITDPFEGREKDIVLLSALGVLSACFPNLFGIYDGDKVYPNLYIIFVAPAASGKGVMNKSRILIAKIHDNIFSKSLAEYKDCNQKKHNKGSKQECPPIQVKIIPANISSAEIYSYLGASTHGVLIIESEADTMSNMLKNDWSNYSDVLRKAYHHENISISRKMEKIFENIHEPKLSIVLSGTPEQLTSLIKSKENGLFSRFTIYTFDEVSEFKDVFSVTSKNYNNVFEEQSELIFKLYGSLSEMDKSIEFQLSETQMEQFRNKFTQIHTDILNNLPNGFISNLNRHGLMLFRICMILSVLRKTESITDIKDGFLICEDVDFSNALDLTITLLQHSLMAYNSIEEGCLSSSDEDLLFSLPSSVFTRKALIELGEARGIPKRTIDEKLIQWKKKKVIKKLKHGTYMRL